MVAGLVLTATFLLQPGLVPRGTRAFVFESIFEVFLLLGTLVGVVVVGYVLYNAYKYRSGPGDDHIDNGDHLVLGELPSGSGGGRKLFTLFFMSMVIVVSLVSWTYLMLLYIEEGPADGESLDVAVEGYRFGWRFTYPNGHTTDGVLRVPADRLVRLTIITADMFHNFGVTELRVKSDTIPDQETEMWFTADEPGMYTAQCYELCGAGHSYMSAEVVVMLPDEHEAWYANMTADNVTADNVTASESSADESVTAQSNLRPAVVP